MATKAKIKPLTLKVPASPKPRNPLVVPALQRKAGAHRKTTSAERTQENAALKQTLKKVLKTHDTDF